MLINIVVMDSHNHHDGTKNLSILCVPFLYPLLKVVCSLLCAFHYFIMCPLLKAPPTIIN